MNLWCSKVSPPIPTDLQISPITGIFSPETPLPLKDDGCILLLSSSVNNPSHIKDHWAPVSNSATSSLLFAQRIWTYGVELSPSEAISFMRCRCLRLCLPCFSGVIILNSALPHVQGFTPVSSLPPCCECCCSTPPLLSPVLAGVTSENPLILLFCWVLKSSCSPFWVVSMSDPPSLSGSSETTHLGASSCSTSIL